jgi:predicted transcriptional regulator
MKFLTENTPNSYGGVPTITTNRMLTQYTESVTRHPSARRSAFEIRMDILRVTTEGCTKPTQIMYRSNTSWIILKKNLESLVASGHMQENSDHSRTTYTVTDSGMAVVRDYRDLVQSMVASDTGPVY